MEIRDPDVPYSCDWSQGIFEVHVTIDSSTHYPAFYSWVALSNSYPVDCMPSREAVCTICMMVFGMTWLGREPTTYCEADTLTTKPPQCGLQSTGSCHGLLHYMMLCFLSFNQEVHHNIHYIAEVKAGVFVIVNIAQEKLVTWGLSKRNMNALWSVVLWAFF